MNSEPISDDIPPQMKILNMVIPILMHFHSFVLNLSIESHMPSNNIYILIVAAIDETIIPSCLHFSMQNIEQSRGQGRASGLSNVNVNQYLSLLINICVTSFTYRHAVMYRTFVHWLFQHLRYK